MRQITYTEAEVEGLSGMGIYLLMKDQGADVFGLWSAQKSDLLIAYREQIGFKA